MIVGSVFALTGIRPGAFTININTRKTEQRMDTVFHLLRDQYYSPGYLLRKIIEEENTY